jgi:hypothetical protein
MRIRLSHPDYLIELAGALLSGNCLSFRVSNDTLEVLHADGSGAAEDERALIFFLRAWQMAHPHVAADLSR